MSLSTIRLLLNHAEIHTQILVLDPIESVRAPRIDRERLQVENLIPLESLGLMESLEQVLRKLEIATSDLRKSDSFSQILADCKLEDLMIDRSSTGLIDLFKVQGLYENRVFEQFSFNVKKHNHQNIGKKRNSVLSSKRKAIRRIC